MQRECAAVDAVTGRKCRRLVHADITHRSERGTFVLTAAPGQTTFAHREALDALALAGRRESDPDDVASGRYATAKKAREKWREKHRASPARSAHLGFANTEGGDRDERMRRAAR